MKDIRELCLTKPTSPSLEEKVNHYHSIRQSTLDIHAPIKSQKCSDCPRIPWFNHEIAEAIRLCIHFERVWYRDKSNRGLLLSSKVNADLYQTSWTKLSKNSSLPPSQRIPLTTNTSMRFVIICLAGLKIHHCPLVSRTMILLLDSITILFKRLPISALILLKSTSISHLTLKDQPLQAHRISAIFSQSLYLNFIRSSNLHLTRTVTPTLYQPVY